MRRRIATIIMVLLLCACGGIATRPDLRRLYQASSSVAVDTQPPVILLHGVFGSRLRDRTTAREIWPGSIGKLAFSEFRDLALRFDPDTLVPIDDGTEAYAIFDHAAGRDFYGAIIDTLAQAGGYAPGVAGQPAPDRRRRYYVFLYDWRRDNIEAVRALDRLIEQIRLDYHDPALRMDLVAHSNGGLIARYYARYGTRDVLDGRDFDMSDAAAAKIRRLILLGTPNFGSISAVTGFINGSDVGLRSIPPEVLMTMPSAYQLFPHALNDWIVTSAGAALDRDVFDVEVWRRFGWGIFDPTVRGRIMKQFSDVAAGERHVAAFERYFEKYLERARGFTWSLTVAETAPGVHPIVFGGDCEFTPARLLVEEENGDSVVRVSPDAVRDKRPGVDYHRLMLEPGDGTVTKASLLAREAVDPALARNPYSHFPLAYSFFLCERHDRLAGNPSFQDNLLHALLSVD